jgi:CDP-diacylglycerol--glycerol-3-phosphate 3-phosphatidyltransferase
MGNESGAVEPKQQRENPMSDSGPPIDSSPRKGKARRRLLTVPNVLSGIRLVGAPWLVVLAIYNQPTAFVLLALILLLDDWIDGKLAILLDQRTEVGAILDSVADALTYAAILFGFAWLKWNLIADELIWLGVALGSYAATVLWAVFRFRRYPSYHTRAAKTCWLLATVAVVAVVMFDQVWPLRVAIVGVTLANLETLAITTVLREYRSNVPSLYHAYFQRTHES